MKLTGDMLRSLRGRRGLDDLNDTSQDVEINKMEPLEIVREISGWKFGDPGIADDFIRWFENVGLLEVKP